MKWLRSDGRRLVVRDVGEPVFDIYCAPGAPLPCMDVVLTEDEARERLRELLAVGAYRREPPPGD